MTGRPLPARVILVTDPAFGDETIERCVRFVADALPKGALCVQLRDKQRVPASLRRFAARLRLVTRDVGASLVVNGNAAIARDVEADGVHLGRDAGPVHMAREICGDKVWISMAAHTDDAVRAGVAAVVDAVLVSPVFTTRAPSRLAPVKPGRGIEALRSACAVAAGRLAVYALGGVTADNAGSCFQAGADGVAAMRALLESPQPATVARALHDGVRVRC